MGNANSNNSDSIVLVERTSGYSLVPASTPLTRLNYYDGLFLRASHLKLEQDYFLELSARSNQAGGWGVVYGFNVSTFGGEELEVSLGQAINGEGKVLLLPQLVRIPIGDLIERSQLVDVATAELLAGVSEFGDCVVEEELPPGQVVEGTSFYLITVAHTEALCGDEDVYGKLCEEACVTSAERPYRIDGLIFRARPLVLETAFKTSSVVTLGEEHLRSQLASAYFADEQLANPNAISGTGLGAGPWCSGSLAPSGGPEVPLAVLGRSGGVTALLDQWTARRERIEAPPRSYWAWKMALRPWNVYLAQVLQFQCQLRHCLGGNGAQLSEAGQAAQLRQTANELFQMLTDQVGTDHQAGLATEARLAEIEKQLVFPEYQLEPVLLNRRLVPCGIVETPPAGYLPVTLSDQDTVNDQVRAWLGDGVDLRFFAVRPDFVPHALEEAQHMERICLLQGLENAEDRPEVDVLVPDGKVVEEVVKQGTIVEGVLELALIRDLIFALAEGAGRFEHRQPEGGSFCFAGVLRCDDLLELLATVIEDDLDPAVFAAAAKPEATAKTKAKGKAKAKAETEAPTLPPLFHKTYAGFRQALRVARESQSGDERLRRELFEARRARAGAKVMAAEALVMEAPPPSVESTVVTAMPSLPAELRDVRLPLIATWITAHWERDPFQLDKGGVAPFGLRWLLAVPVGKWFVDFRLDGALAVNSNTLSGGVRTVKGIFPFVASVETPSSFDEIPFGWPVQLERRESGGVETVVTTLERIPWFDITTKTSRDPALRVRGSLNFGSEQSKRPFLHLGLSENPEALMCDAEPRNRAIEAITIIDHLWSEEPAGEEGPEMLFERDEALGCLFPPAPEQFECVIVPTKDWVFFHRRRDKLCESETVAPPAEAPESPGALAGTVSDGTGAAMPGVSLTAKNRTTGATFQQVTAADGSYRFVGLPPGVYDVYASLDGFGTVHEVLHIQAAGQITQDYTLEPGS